MCFIIDIEQRHDLHLSNYGQLLSWNNQGGWENSEKLINKRGGGRALVLPGGVGIFKQFF